MSTYTRKIIVLMILSFIILTYIYNIFLSKLTAQYVASILSYFIGIAPVIAGNILFININDDIVPILISFECTGFMFISIYTLMMFMMPAISLQHRLLSLLLVPVIYFANIARIVFSVILGIYTDVPIMTYFHDTVGQVFLLIFTVLTLLIYLNIFGYIKLRRVL